MIKRQFILEATCEGYETGTEDERAKHRSGEDDRAWSIRLNKATEWLTYRQFARMGWALQATCVAWCPYCAKEKGL